MIVFPRDLVAVLIMLVPTSFIAIPAVVVVAIISIVLVPIISAVTFVDSDPSKPIDSVIPFIEPVVPAIVPEVHLPETVMLPVAVCIAARYSIALHDDDAWCRATVRIIAAVVIAMRV